MRKIAKIEGLNFERHILDQDLMHRNSPYISLKNYLREFDKRS